jgi:hypothetical protein
MLNRRHLIKSLAAAVAAIKSAPLFGYEPKLEVPAPPEEPTLELEVTGKPVGVRPLELYDVSSYGREITFTVYDERQGREFLEQLTAGDKRTYRVDFGGGKAWQFDAYCTRVSTLSASHEDSRIEVTLRPTGMLELEP